MNMTEDTKMYSTIYDESDIVHIMNKYSITKNGFLPERCVTIDELINRYPERFTHLKDVVANLSEEVCDGKTFRDIVHGLPEYDNRLHNIDGITEQEAYTMYSILTMIVNRYIWCTGVDDAKRFNTIPPILAVPLFIVSNMLGIAPTLTHASVDLWNWRKNNRWQDADPFELDSFDVINSLSGNISEEWFYKVMIAIEGITGDSLLLISQAHKYFDNKDALRYTLSYIGDRIHKAVKLVNRMYERCVPDFYFDHLRIYLSGSKNDNLPKGVDLDLTPISAGLYNLKLIGGSAAQSTLIQVYDAFFGIMHEGRSKQFLNTTKEYMPQRHRDYLKMVQCLPSLRDYVNASDDEDIKKLYTACVTALKRFRDAHLALVDIYIMKPASMRKVGRTIDVGSALTERHQNNNAGYMNCSGSGDPVEFCKGFIDTTQRSYIGGISSRTIELIPYNREDGIKKKTAVIIAFFVLLSAISAMTIFE